MCITTKESQHHTTLTTMPASITNSEREKLPHTMHKVGSEATKTIHPPPQARRKSLANQTHNVDSSSSSSICNSSGRRVWVLSLPSSSSGATTSPSLISNRGCSRRRGDIGRPSGRRQASVAGQKQGCVVGVRRRRKACEGVRRW